MMPQLPRSPQLPRPSLAGCSAPFACASSLDERPASINDAFFVVDMVNYGNPRAMQVIDHPGIQHNNACGFSFADGHAEIKKWRDPAMLSKNASARVPAPI